MKEDLFDRMVLAQREINALMPTMTWETADAQALMTHFTGRGDGWTVQLVVLGLGANRTEERMGTAAKGDIILKLTDEQCEAAERYARFRAGPGSEPARCSAMHDIDLRLPARRCILPPHADDKHLWESPAGERASRGGKGCDCRSFATIGSHSDDCNSGLGPKWGSGFGGRR